MASSTPTSKFFVPHSVNARQCRLIATTALLFFVAMMLLMATDAPSSFFQFGTTYTTSGGKQAIDYGDGEMMHVWPSPEDRVAPATIQCLQARLPMGGVDMSLVSVLAQEPIRQLEQLNRVSYKVTFQNGMKAAFKIYGGTRDDHSMEHEGQTGWNDQGFAEIAAFHVDRILAINRAPVVIGRALPLAELKKITDDKYHPYMDRCAVEHGGIKLVRGALVEWTALANPKGITDQQLGELKTMRKGPGESNNVAPGMDDTLRQTRQQLNTLLAFDYLILNEDRVKPDNYFLACPPGQAYAAGARMDEMINAGCTFTHLDNGLSLYEMCDEPLSEEAYLRKFQDVGSRPHRALYVTRPFRNCVYEDRVAQSIREHSQNLGQQLVESLSCDPMHKFGAVLQYYPADCYAEGINRRARILTRLLDMCAAGAKEALIPLPLPLPTS